MTFNKKQYDKNYFKKHPWIKSFYHARRRCNNPKHEKYKYYGGKGIKCLLTSEEVKKLWFRDKAYEMKQPTLDRVNGKKHYEFSNCQFMEMEKNRMKGGK
jgi:hypothetical protein